MALRTIVVFSFHQSVGATPIRPRTRKLTLGRCLEEMGYTLQASAKTREGPQHPDRDRPVSLSEPAGEAFRRAGAPVTSVDTKKKELVGAFKNVGAQMVAQRGGRSGFGARLPAHGQRQGDSLRRL
jgi:hypothetical protein